MGVTARPPELGEWPAQVVRDPEGDTGGKPASWASVLRVLSTYRSPDRETKAGDHLFTVGQPCEAIHVLTRGWAYVFSPLADGRQMIFQFVVPGSVIAFNPEPDAIAPWSARTLTDSTFHVISHEQLTRLFREDPDTAARLTALLAQDRQLAFDRLMSICRFSARHRVSRLLLELARHGFPSAQRVGARDLFIPVTQEHVADATGLSTVHVNRVLSALRRDRVVEFQHRRLRILNLPKLKAVAEGDERLRPRARLHDVWPPWSAGA
jgi:CRP/FNR family transcriptional regulator